MDFWLIVCAVGFLGLIEAISKYTNAPLKPRPARPSQLDRCFVPDEDWVGTPML